MRALGGALLLVALSSRGAEWTAGGAGLARVEAISNPGLSAKPRAVTRTSVGAELDLAARAPLWEARLGAGYVEYLSGRRTGTSDESLSASATRRFRTATLGAAASWQRGIPDNEEIGLGGALLSPSRRTTWSVSPSWQRSIDERLLVSASATLGAIGYEVSRAGLPDSRSASLAVSLAYSLTPRTSLGASAALAASDTEPLTTRSRTRSLQATLAHAFSARWSASAAYGPSRTRSRSAAFALVCPVTPIFCEAGLVPFTVLPETRESATRGTAYDFSVRYRLAERTTASLAASRETAPAGAGVATETEAASVSLAHQLAAHLSLGAEAGETRSQTAAELAGAGATRTRHASARLAWQADRHWQLDAGLSAQQARLPGGARRRSETLFVGLRYVPQRMRLP